MKYVISWFERPQGSPADYEGAQKRILDMFRQWHMPESLKIQQFLVRVGEFGGYMVVETDDPQAIHRLTSTFAAFQFRVEPVMDIADAVSAEVEAIQWRESLG
jgi:hypothetical protein